MVVSNRNLQTSRGPLFSGAFAVSFREGSIFHHLTYHEHVGRHGTSVASREDLPLEGVEGGVLGYGGTKNLALDVGVYLLHHFFLNLCLFITLLSRTIKVV